MFKPNFILQGVLQSLKNAVSEGHSSEAQIFFNISKDQALQST